ncbi:MAG: 2-oxoacid:acceptor oxidoreductase family protein [Candidatus Sericytochromatia bacterium]
MTSQPRIELDRAAIRVAGALDEGRLDWPLLLTPQGLAPDTGSPDVLVALDPLALRQHLAELPAGGTLLVDVHHFNARNCDRAGYPRHPLEDGSLEGYHLLRVNLSALARDVLAEAPDLLADVRSRALLALGMLCWMYRIAPAALAPELAERLPDFPLLWRERCLEAGWSYAARHQLLPRSFEAPLAPLSVGVYRMISGHQALVLGWLVAAQQAQRPLFVACAHLGSDWAAWLSRHGEFGQMFFQSEDDAGAVAAALGASQAGGLGVCVVSGNGLAQAADSLRLAAEERIPLVVLDLQRTGRVAEGAIQADQSNLWQALHGHGARAPVAVMACSLPSRCFDQARAAAQLAQRCRLPVVILSDGYLAHGTGPWRVPEPETLTPWSEDATAGEPLPSAATLLDAAIPPQEVGGSEDAELLVLGWGSTHSVIAAAVAEAQAQGLPVAHAQLTHLHPLPGNLGEVLKRYPRLLVPELNNGQLAGILQARYARRVQSFSASEGRPLRVHDVLAQMTSLLQEERQ